jgi:Uma2 family endonuclease
MVTPALSSIDDFLAWEVHQEEKYEFVDGKVSLFPGGTKRHTTIGLNIAMALRLGGLAAGTVLYETKSITARSSRYPDVVVSLDPRDRPEHTALRYPIAIVEVLSPSTEVVDRGAKLDEYRTIETLQEYVLVDSRKRWAQVVRRIADEWIVSLPLEAGHIELRSLGVSILFDDVYAGTEL